MQLNIKIELLASTQLYKISFKMLNFSLFIHRSYIACLLFSFLLVTTNPTNSTPKINLKKLMNIQWTIFFESNNHTDIIRKETYKNISNTTGINDIYDKLLVKYPNLKNRKILFSGPLGEKKQNFKKLAIYIPSAHQNNTPLKKLAGYSNDADTLYFVCKVSPTTTCNSH